MHTLFIASTLAPSTLDDDNLDRHIRLLLVQLKSIILEMEYSWNKPGKEALNKTLRAQLNEVAAQLTAAQSVYEFRMNSMR